MRGTTSVVFGILFVVCTSTIIGGSQAQPAKRADWQSDWAKFVEAYNACMKSTSCDLNQTFMAKPVTWSGVFKSLDETEKVASVTMVPATSPITDRNGQAGTFSCCAVQGIADLEAWKALSPGAAVTFTAIVGGRSFHPVFMIRDFGAVILGDAKLVPKKMP